MAYSKAHGFWPDGARLVISLSMQFEAGSQGDRNNGAPFPPVPDGVPDLIGRSWFDYRDREGIPRLLDLFARHRIHVTSHMVRGAVEHEPLLARAIVERGHETAAHGQTWVPHRVEDGADEQRSNGAVFGLLTITDLEHAPMTPSTGTDKSERSRVR